MRRPSNERGTRRNSKGQKGAALVESALVLVTMLSMIVFMMDMGRVLLLQQFIVERARTTVRTAVVQNWNSSTAANFLCYNSTTPPSQDTNTPGYLGLLPSQVTYQALGTSGQPDYRIQIVVSGVQVLTWIPYLSGQFTLPKITVTMPAQSLGAAT